ncbi:MAG: tetratricopeptide repeat protein [Smithellaceae bacterium]
MGLAAVLSKENAAMLPVSILLFDLFLIQGVNKDSVKKMLKISILPFVIILVIAFIYTGGFSLALGGFELRDFTMVQRLLTEPRVILFYLSLLFYPINSRLTLLYDIDVSRTMLQPWTTIPSIILIVFIISFAFYIAKKRPLLSFCIIFYFLNHLIEGTVFSLELIFEHRNYLPAMLLFVPIAEFIISAIDYFSYRKLIQFTVAFGIVIMLTGLGDNTFRRNEIFSSDFHLWFDNIDKSPKLSRPHANLGRIYFNSNMNDKALAEYKKAIELNDFASMQILAIQDYNLGLLYFMEINNDLAMKYFQKSSAVLPEYIQNIIHIAKIKTRQNKIQEAREIIKDKLNKYPDSLELMELYSFILLKSGEINESQYFAKKCIIQNSNTILPLKIMAEICRQKNNYAGAISYWKSIRSLATGNAFANLALIELYAKINDHKMLNQEIQLLLCLKGSSKFKEYIKKLTKDEMLLVYVPDRDNLSLILKKNLMQFISLK